MSTSFTLFEQLWTKCQKLTNYWRVSYILCWVSFSKSFPFLDSKWMWTGDPFSWKILCEKHIFWPTGPTTPRSKVDVFPEEFPLKTTFLIGGDTNITSPDVIIQLLHIHFRHQWVINESSKFTKLRIVVEIAHRFYHCIVLAKEVGILLPLEPDNF